MQNEVGKQREKAPWPDYENNDLFEGDIIIHPNGETGIIEVDKNFANPNDRWRVNYGNRISSRLNLQVGKKGKAVKKKEQTKITHDPSSLENDEVPILHVFEVPIKDHSFTEITVSPLDSHEYKVEGFKFLEFVEIGAVTSPAVFVVGEKYKTKNGHTAKIEFMERGYLGGFILSDCVVTGLCAFLWDEQGCVVGADEGFDLIPQEMRSTAVKEVTQDSMLAYEKAIESLVKTKSQIYSQAGLSVIVKSDGSVEYVSHFNDTEKELLGIIDELIEHHRSEIFGV